jgi:predicted O-methyltransferase YrrM
VAPKALGGVSAVSAAKTSTEKPSPDPFAAVREATLAHRASHGCGAYPYDNGALLGALAAAANAQRVLELGTALGYTALWFAHGAPQAVIDSIERDGEHVRLAREQVEAHGMAGHIVVHEGEFAAVMRRLDPGYDVAFFDGLTPSRPLLKEMRRLLRARGPLISANLTHTGAEAYLATLQDKKSWLTAFIDEDRETALSIKL